MFGVAPISTVGSKNVRPRECRLPPITTVAPCETASAMWASTLRTALSVDQRPLGHARFEAGTHHHLRDATGERGH